MRPPFLAFSFSHTLRDRCRKPRRAKGARARLARTSHPFLRKEPAPAAATLPLPPAARKRHLPRKRSNQFIALTDSANEYANQMFTGLITDFTVLFQLV